MKQFLDICEHSQLHWFSKEQSRVETSVFGAKFVVMKQCIDALRDLRYKLRMLGIPRSGPSYFCEDNMSVVHNTSRPESVLRKKINSVCYHVVHETVPMDESLV